MPIDVFLSLALRVAAGAWAIQSAGGKLEPERALRYGLAAVHHGLAAGVDPFELVAVARNESDFQEDIRGPDGKDCGLTQTRVTVTRYSCRQLRGSYWIAFQEAARELAENAAACRRGRSGGAGGARADFDRCRINRYNSGVRYARSGVHGAYWLRIRCFAEAARAQRDPGTACRRVRSRADVSRVVERALPRRAPRMAAAAVEVPSS